MGFRADMMDVVCRYGNQLMVLFYLLVVMFLLTLFTLVFGRPGTASYALAIFNAGLIVLGLLVTGGTAWYCRQRTG